MVGIMMGAPILVAVYAACEGCVECPTLVVESDLGLYIGGCVECSTLVGCRKWLEFVYENDLNLYIMWG